VSVDGYVCLKDILKLWMYGSNMFGLAGQITVFFGVK
jgi:hypothetical protein